MRLLPLPSDPSTFVNLDTINAGHIRPYGSDGTVTFDTTHGSGELAVVIVDGCALELQGPTQTWLWDTFPDADQAQRELERVTGWPAWHPRSDH